MNVQSLPDNRFFVCKSLARLAQSVERKALNLVVVGSSPTFGVADFHIHLNAWRNGSA